LRRSLMGELTEREFVVIPLSLQLPANSQGDGPRGRRACNAGLNCASAPPVS
jgi:hypothetical protein